MELHALARERHPDHRYVLARALDLTAVAGKLLLYQFLQFRAFPLQGGRGAIDGRMAGFAKFGMEVVKVPMNPSAAE